MQAAGKLTPAEQAEAAERAKEIHAMNVRGIIALVFAVGALVLGIVAKSI
jgi:hypothetical protein